MISREELLRIAKLYGMRSWQQEKHYIQSLILVSIEDIPIVFKGGTYLWFFYGLPRFSEDLDFSAFGETNKNLPGEVSRSLELFGVENSLKLITNDDKTLSFRLSAKGPLNTSDIDLCHVYVEISKREEIIMKQTSIHTKTEPYGLPVKILRGMNLYEVAAEKVRTLLIRDKVRDLYDLWFLAKKGYVPQKALINEKLRFYNLEFSFSVFAEKLQRKEGFWLREVKPILFDVPPDFKSVFEYLTEIFKGI